MKLVTFTHESAMRAGALVHGGQAVADLDRAHRRRWGLPSEALESVLAILEAGPQGMQIARDTLAAALADGNDLLRIDTVKLLAPIPRPPQIRDFLCFEQHLLQGFATARKVRAMQSDDPAAALRDMEEKGVLAVPAAWYERPLYYHPNRMNVVGPDEPLLWPAFTTMLDFELEFGCYIGKPGRDITRKDARDHIAGYTIFNDMSARDEQMKCMPGQLGPGKGKSFDTGKVMGPCLVTPDELPDPYCLEMKVRVDGEEWGRGNSRDMHWKFEDCIAEVSRSETLYTGEFLASGTVGNGCGLEKMRFLKPDSVVELEVEGIGILRNRVGSPDG